MPTIDHAIFAELIQSFSSAVEDLGFTILLASHGYSLEREYALTRKMLEHRVDGIGLIGIEHSSDTYELLAQQNTPALLLWNHSPDAPLPCVGSDNYLAGYQIGQHVADLGHEKIASIFPPLYGNDRASLRMQGVTEALQKAGRDIREIWRLETPYSVAAAKEVALSLVDAEDLPTAIICGNDVLAWGALHALSRAGIDVPGKMTVTGIGDFNGSKDFEPSLTTVRIPARTIGEKAANAIVQLITKSGEADAGRAGSAGVTCATDKRCPFSQVRKLNLDQLASGKSQPAICQWFRPCHALHNCNFRKRWPQSSAPISWSSNGKVPTNRY